MIISRSIVFRSALVIHETEPASYPWGVIANGNHTDGGTERAAAIAAAYSAEDYHQQSDEWSPDWDLSGLVADAELIYAVAERLGNGSEWPNWAEGSEFKALRDASADARSQEQ